MFSEQSPCNRLTVYNYFRGSTEMSLSFLCNCPVIGSRPCRALTVGVIDFNLPGLHKTHGIWIDSSNPNIREAARINRR
jgi:hypothetical protein